MILNERKIKILEAIITDYIQTAEPIGSRTIAKKYDLGISSATIRNEMSDLEELGFIIQPHTSSGRVPSEKGYRLYVDNLMKRRELTNEETDFLQKIIKGNINQIDYLMQQTAKALAALTNYTTIISEPKAKTIKIKHVQIIPFDEHSIITVVVTDNKAVKNHIIHVENAPEAEVLNEISNIINELFKTHTVEEVGDEFIKNSQLKEREYGDIIYKVIEAVLNTVRAENSRHLYTSGVNNILDFPEFSDIEKAKAIFTALEEKETLMSVFESSEHGEEGSVEILIGDENSLAELKGCSVIKTEYKVGDNVGTIGIIGPTRMDYAQVVSVLNGMVKNINEVIKALSGG